jgi:hypothetical protein
MHGVQRIGILQPRLPQPPPRPERKDVHFPIILSIMVPKAFEAGYSNTTGFRKVVKATILVKKKEGMSDEAFIEYYNNVHAQQAVPILQRHGIISYSLVMPPQSLNFVASEACRIVYGCVHEADGWAADIPPG